jgi:hypothetical protein
MAITINGTGSITGLTAGGLPDGSVTTDDLAANAVTAVKIASDAAPATSLAVISDHKPDQTKGGTFTSGAWRTRDLNTQDFDPDGIVSISSNDFTLIPGTYLIRWECPAYFVIRHQTRLFNITDNSVVEYGMCLISNANSTDPSIGSVVVTITANTTFRLQHRCSTTRADDGFGPGGYFAADGERYSRVTLWKVA